MSNATWVCFHCREAVRRPAHYSDAVLCPQCGRACLCLGTRIRIPAKGNASEWQALRAGIREELLASQEPIGGLRVRLRHKIERRIVDLESLATNDGRVRSTQLLRQQLASL